eukprot:scaffold31187_cov49-Cyclotella_meneghiniana.AAC.1
MVPIIALGPRLLYQVPLTRHFNSSLVASDHFTAHLRSCAVGSAFCLTCRDVAGFTREHRLSTSSSLRRQMTHRVRYLPTSESFAPRKIHVGVTPKPSATLRYTYHSCLQVVHLRTTVNLCVPSVQSS